jgi:hypothetical protein
VGDVVLASGGTLAGTVTAGNVSGSGLIAPGNSPGIATATSVSLSGGAGFAFEFGSASVNPTYSNTTASVNDVFHLTGANPFASTTATGANVFNIYLGVSTLTGGDTFNGGIFADQGGDFALTLASGTYNYYVLGDGSGTHAYNGTSYYTLAEYNPGLSISDTTSAVTGANFLSGTVDGYQQQFIVGIPEPGTYAMALGGFGMLIAFQRMRRRSSKE